VIDALNHGEADFAWAVRGGYGAARLDPLSGDTLRSRPLLGFSDVTVLLGLVERAGGVAIHGPVLTQLPDVTEASRADMLRCLRGEPRRWSRLIGPDLEPSGPMAGGNLTVLASLCGTPMMPKFSGRVVVIEDVGEPMYRLDRSLHQLLSGSDLRQAAACVLGSFVGCPEGADEALAEELGHAGLATWRGAPVGHGKQNHSFILGEAARIDADSLHLGGALESSP